MTDPVVALVAGDEVQPVDLDKFVYLVDQAWACPTASPTRNALSQLAIEEIVRQLGLRGRLEQHPDD